MFPIGQLCAALSKDIIYGFQWDARIGTAKASMQLKGVNATLHWLTEKSQRETNK